MSTPAPDTPNLAHADPDAVLWRPAAVGLKVVNGACAVGRLLTPLAILLGLPLMIVLLALPFVVPAVAAAFLVHALGFKPVMLTGAAVMIASMLIGLSVPYTRDRVLRYHQRLQDISNTVPSVVRVKAGEVAYLRRRLAPVPPDPLPATCFAEVEGPGVFIVRGGREVIWNGTRAGYDKWLSETDLASL